MSTFNPHFFDHFYLKRFFVPICMSTLLHYNLKEIQNIFHSSVFGKSVPNCMYLFLNTFHSSLNVLIFTQRLPCIHIQFIKICVLCAGNIICIDQWFHYCWQMSNNRYQFAVSFLKVYWSYLKTVFDINTNSKLYNYNYDLQ